MTRWLAGLSGLTDLYDGYVVDQFGVLHDGHSPYPGAADALRELRARGKRVIVLSNSGKRAAPNARRLAQFGVTPQHYDALITSGELMFQMLRQRDRAPFSTLGRRVWLGCPDDDAPTLDGLDLQIVDHPAQADFVLLASLPDVAGAAQALHPALDEALARGLPLICANPDQQRLTARGLEPAPGSLARRHAAGGGEVIWLGKPHGLIYTICREALGRWGSRHFLAVGDSLEHDIGGGARAGYDTCFIAGGLHAADFATPPDDPLAGEPQPGGSAPPGILPDGPARDRCLQALLQSPAAQAAPAPTWALPTLRWAAPDAETPPPPLSPPPGGLRP